MLRIRKKPLARHHQDSVRRGVRRSQLHCASAGAAKAPYSLAPSSFPNCDRCAGSQFGDTRALPVSGLLFPFLHRARRFFSFSKKRKKRMGAQKSGRPMVAPTFIDGNAIGFVGAGNARQTIPQSASLTAPFTQGSLWPLRRGKGCAVRAFARRRVWRTRIYGRSRCARCPASCCGSRRAGSC